MTRIPRRLLLRTDQDLGGGRVGPSRTNAFVGLKYCTFIAASLFDIVFVQRLLNSYFFSRFASFPARTYKIITGVSS
jgi:hypothetical protein